MKKAKKFLSIILALTFIFSTCITPISVFAADDGNTQIKKNYTSSVANVTGRWELIDGGVSCVDGKYATLLLEQTMTSGTLEFDVNSFWATTDSGCVSVFVQGSGFDEAPYNGSDVDNQHHFRQTAGARIWFRKGVVIVKEEWAGRWKGDNGLTDNAGPGRIYNYNDILGTDWKVPESGKMSYKVVFGNGSLTLSVNGEEAGTFSYDQTKVTGNQIALIGTDWAATEITNIKINGNAVTFENPPPLNASVYVNGAKQSVEKRYVEWDRDGYVVEIEPSVVGATLECTLDGASVASLPKFIDPGTYRIGYTVSKEEYNDDHVGEFVLIIKRPEENSATFAGVLSVMLLLGIKQPVDVVDDNGDALAGASFELYRIDSEGNHKLMGTYTSDADGAFTLRKLSEKYSYELIQTDAPVGYIVSEEPIAVKADPDADPLTIVVNSKEKPSVAHSTGIWELIDGGISCADGKYAALLLNETMTEGTVEFDLSSFWATEDSGCVSVFVQGSNFDKLQSADPFNPNKDLSGARVWFRKGVVVVKDVKAGDGGNLPTDGVDGKIYNYNDILGTGWKVPASGKMSYKIEFGNGYITVYVNGVKAGDPVPYTASGSQIALMGTNFGEIEFTNLKINGVEYNWTKSASETDK